jgi:aspartyl-tRNA(Asn)/glutamyl-tRNA(Gln) amidotransferase subunit A
LGAVALGTDAGGSVRRPAAHVGVFGMKPTQGRIPHPVGFTEPVFGQSVIGIMARSTADIRLFLDAMSVRDAREVMSPPVFPTESRRLNDIRVAYSPRLGRGFPVDEEVQSAVARHAQLLERSGCRVEEADPAWPPGTDESALMPLQFAGLAALYGDTWKKSPELFDPDIGAQIEQGLSMSAAQVANALYLREELARVLARFQADYDLLITPTTPCVAWPLDQLGPPMIEGQEVTPRGHAVFTPIFNHTFVPACSVPCDVGPDGLPIGLQIVGRRFEDELVIAAAAAIEKASAAGGRRPRRINVNG